MANSATGLETAHAIVTKPLMSDEELRRRRREDFDFLVLCQYKNNMGMYHMCRDTSLDAEKHRKL